MLPAILDLYGTQWTSLLYRKGDLKYIYLLLFTILCHEPGRLLEVSRVAQYYRWRCEMVITIASQPGFYNLLPLSGLLCCRLMTTSSVIGWEFPPGSTRLASQPAAAPHFSTESSRERTCVAYCCIVVGLSVQASLFHYFIFSSFIVIAIIIVL